MAAHSQDPLVAATVRFEQRLNAGSQGQEQAWAQRLREAVRELEVALGRHPAPSEKSVLAPAGPPQREISPGLTRQVQHLGHDHQVLLDQVDVLRARLQRDTFSPDDLAAIRQLGADLLTKLRDYSAAENAVILETVMGEPGTGD